MPTFQLIAPADSGPSRAGRLPLIGGALCLNFINTSSGRGTDQHLDHLQRFEHLLAWARHAGAIDDEGAGAMAAAAARSPRSAKRTLSEAIELRESLHALFCAAIAGSPPPAKSLAFFNHAHSQAMAATAIEPAAEGFVLGWPRQAWRLERLLWPVIRSAAELLTEGPLERVKACPGSYCGWLFFDTTRNGRRRWCEMEVCGSRAKMRRYHHRRRAGASANGRL